MRKIPAALAVLLLSATGAAAQELACAQVRLIVPYPAGGATDVASRVVSERLEGALKKPVIVENRGGATGNIGTAAVVSAPPDGCTLLVNATVIATFVHSFAKLGYDPIKDLAPVGGIGVTPVLFVAAPSVPADNIKELVELSKSRPDGLNYSSAGYGLQQHLAAEEIAQRTGAKFTHVAYRGGGPAMTDLIAARLDFGVFLAGTTKPLIADGKLKALATRPGQALRASAGDSHHRRAGTAGHECRHALHGVRAGGDAEASDCADQCGAAQGDRCARAARALQADRLRGDAHDGGGGGGRDAAHRRALRAAHQAAQY